MTEPKLTTIRIEPGKEYEIQLPYSEVNMHMGVAGQTHHVTLCDDLRSARVTSLKGREFIGVVSYSEAGIYRSFRGFYAYVKPAPEIVEGTVIEGTMRPEDLIPAFCNTLAHYGETERVQELEAEYREVFAALAHSELGGLDPQDDDPLNLLDALFDALNDIAPEGMYFGAHPGNGSDYGFWRIEEEDQDLTRCVHCHAVIDTSLGAYPPGRFESRPGTQAYPKAPGDYDNVCDTCNYGQGLTGGPM